jgi:hypothetical protein
MERLAALPGFRDSADEDLEHGMNPAVAFSPGYAAASAALWNSDFEDQAQKNKRRKGEQLMNNMSSTYLVRGRVPHQTI